MTEDDPSLGGGGTDSGDPTTPASLSARYPSIVAAYQKYLGRAPSDQEILAHTGNGSWDPQGDQISQQIQYIQNSPEGLAYHPGATTPPAATAPPPSAPSGPGTGAYQPWNTPYTAPGQLDLGGQKGLAFIPPAPTFDFQAPSIDQAMQEPGYQFAFNEGKRALETSAAAKGLLGSSGTLRSLEDYGQQAATQNYGNVYNRAFTLSQARFNPLLSEWGTLGQAGQRQDELQQQRAFDLYKQHYAEYFDWNNQDWARKYAAGTAQ